MRLEHVNLTVTDVDRSIDFYRDLFGLRLRWKGMLDDTRHGAHVGDDHFYIALFQATGAGTAPYDYGAVGVNHFGLVIDDLDKFVAELEARGLQHWVVDEYGPGRRAYFFDPDGHELEVVEYTGVPRDVSPTAA
jgi:catechol 2,3-dioxygenase-like lactoylglutathione lyase family enzyme